MTDMKDPGTEAREVLDATTYVVLSTAGLDGRPWATPVYFAHDGLDRVLWVSRPETTHSSNIAERPEISLVVFNSQVPVGSARAFYAQAVAELVPPDEIDADVAIFSARLEAGGAPPWTAEQVRSPAELRLYRARISGAWVLATDGGPDRRIPVPIGVS